jgi:hypothetical protein
MISAFFTMILKVLADSFKDWFKEERVEADAWAAKAKEQQLESMRDGIEREKLLQKELVDVGEKAKTFSAADWAAGKTLLLCFLLLPLAGCFRFYVYSKPYQPVPPPLPPRPAYTLLPEEVVSDRELSVIQYAATVEKSYNTVRADIIKQNVESGYPDVSQ